MTTIAEDLLNDFESDDDNNEDEQQNGEQFGDQDGVEDVVLSKRRVMYEEQVKENPKNYDSWFDYARLEETAGNPDRVREVYERAIAMTPPSQEKRHWRRYIYLWVFYALYEELTNRDMDRAGQIYQACLDLIPHKQFTFGKIWILKAHFELRQGQLDKARKTMGIAIGKCPKNKLFRAYIEMELKLFEFTRCRTLYEKWIEHDSGNCTAWIKFAELERGLEDYERVRAIYELAVMQPQLDMPELLWKAYIDFEEEEGEYERTRALYERLLEKTEHVKVWTSYAHFEINVPDNDVEIAEDEEVPISDAAKSRARAVFKRAHNLYKSNDSTNDRVALLHAWKSFEDAHGSDEDKEAIAKQMPRKVKKRRRLDDDSFEEYMDYVFPADDAGAAKMSKLMAQAQAWKRQQEANASAL